MKYQKLILILIFAFCCDLQAGAQTLEKEVIALVDQCLRANGYQLSSHALKETRWETTDILGKRQLSFSARDRYKLKNAGFQANISNQKGKWYINNEYIILVRQKNKTPIYVLKNGEEIVLVDEEQITVLKQLLTEASYKDGAVKPYSEEEIFNFLNGFKLIQ